MFTAILWDYDGTLANTPVKNIAVTRAVLGRLDPALLDPLPEALSSLAAYQAANYRWRNWRELYQHALRVPADRLDEAGALWGPCQLADRTLPPLFGGLLEVLHRLGHECPQLDAQLCHIIASGMFNGIFEIVVHDMPKEQAVRYVDQLRDFYTAGWMKLIGQS